MHAAVTPGDSCYDYPHFAVEETEAQRGECILQGPTGGGVEEASNQRGSRALTLNHMLSGSGVSEAKRPRKPPVNADGRTSLVQPNPMAQLTTHL